MHKIAIITSLWFCFSAQAASLDDVIMIPEKFTPLKQKLEKTSDYSNQSQSSQRMQDATQSLEEMQETMQSLEEMQEAMQTLTYAGEYFEMMEQCGFSAQNAQMSQEESMKCVINEGYPLAEKGNYLAAQGIAETYYALGYKEEALKWYEYTLSLEMPSDVKIELQKGYDRMKQRQ